MGITKSVLKRPITTVLAVLCLLVFGLSSVFSSKMELTPEMNFPMMMITAVYAGASPDDVNELITKPIEESVGTLSGIKNIQSMSQENISIVMMEYEYGTDMDKAYSDLKKKMDSITMPDDVDSPRPSEAVKAMLQDAGVEDMDIVITDKQTYIAPFVNAEEPQYLVVEDHFPNGRPALEKAGVYMTSRETVNKAERMKVTVCLNPIHTALAPYGCMLGFKLFSDQMSDPELVKLAEKVGLQEGMEFVEDPGIISPKAFIDECINVRFSNPYLGDTPQRIAVDTSQMVGIRFGENIKACVHKYGDAKKLKGIQLAIAGWLRYLLAVDDDGKPFALSPDPMILKLQGQMAGIAWGDPDSLKDQLRPILGNANIFGIDLYEAGIGDDITEMVREEIAGKGAVREVLRKYLK